jgi:DeoR/GlpR family transcriptional regulator of sugar metabolism
MTMVMDLFLEERRRLILEQLKREGRVSVRALSEALNVSAVTIRGDLRTLEEAGLLERTYGGAVLPLNEQSGPELSFDIRQRRAGQEKADIARAAAALIREDDSVALDASTTAFALVPHLRRFQRLTVVTNSLMVAYHLLDAPQIQVVMPGGRLRRDSIALVGGAESLPELHLNIGFFGARGISARAGFTDSDPDEAAFKRALLARCPRPVIVAHADKWDKVAPYAFAEAGAVNAIITTPGVVPDAFRALGIEVLVV